MFCLLEIEFLNAYVSKLQKSSIMTSIVKFIRKKCSEAPELKSIFSNTLCCASKSQAKRCVDAVMARTLE